MPGYAVNLIANRVRDERLRLRWSVRDAAAAGGISNTWWAKFEDGVQPLTEGIIAAVAKAYGWDDNWASQPDELDVLRGQVGELARAVRELLRTAGLDVETWLRELPASDVDAP